MADIRDPLKSVSADNVDMETARFFARQRSDNFGVADKREFDAWFEKSQENRDAFAAYQELWDEIGEASADTEILAMRNAALAGKPPQKGRRFWPHGLAIAASIALVAILLPLFLLPSNKPEQHGDQGKTQIVADAASPVLKPTLYRTQTGQQSTINLSDGSRIELNTDSIIQVNYSNKSRQLVLLRGEAYFKVAKDPSRPFFVLANDKRVTAVGTEFSVRMDKDRVRINLLEGVVSVDRANSDGEFLPGVGRETQVMQAGEQLVAVERQPFQKAESDTEIATSWRHGRVVFENEPLSRVVPELNRYTSRKLVIGSESLADLRVSGSFRAGSSDKFAKTLEATFPVRANAEADRVVLNWSE